MAAVSGVSNGVGVPGVRGDAGGSDNDGVQGFTQSVARAGVIGVNTVAGVGVKGVSDFHDAVQGFSKSADHAGIVGANTAGVGVRGISETGIGVFGKGGKLAGFFEGDVVVTGDIRLGNADCAEDFNIAGLQPAEPGTVMVLNDAGELAVSAHAYDRRVAGVVSGAVAYKPGIILDRHELDRDETEAVRQPIGLLGKVFCKVDAQFSAITVGDLLTTSPTPGHAMATNDPIKSFGAVIGKALRPLAEGQGVIPILITLQ